LTRHDQILLENGRIVLDKIHAPVLYYWTCDVCAEYLDVPAVEKIYLTRCHALLVIVQTQEGWLNAATAATIRIREKLEKLLAKRVP